MKKTHKSLISALMLAGLLSPALLLHGCLDTGGNSASLSQGAQVAKASVGVSVEFPSAGASATRIDENATTLLVEVWDATNQECYDYGCYGSPTGSATLEKPANGGVVNGVIENISPGEALVRISQLDAEGNVLETVNVSANLVEGDNAMTVTMVRAAWVLEDAVVFNKTRLDDTTQVDSFSLIPDQYAYYEAAAATGNVNAYSAMKAAEVIGRNLIYGASSYRTVLKGSNLCSYDAYDDYGGNGGFEESITCGQSQLASRYYDEGGLMYFNRHDSANSAKNYAMFSAMDDDQPLTAASDGKERGWFAMSVGPDGEFLELANEYEESGGTTEISDDAVWNDMMISVTAGDTIEGNFIEWLEKSYVTSNRSCYTQQWVDNQLVKETITCPAQATKASKAAAKPHGSAFRKAAAKAVKAAQAKAGKAVANAQGCYVNLQINYQDSDYGGWYLDGQFAVSWYYTEDVTETLDLCRHPFVAKASQLQQADIDLVNGSDMTPVRAQARR